MNRTEFIVAMTIVLFLAFGLGWFASWLVHRFTRVTQAEISDLDQMARNLHDAEEARDEALTYFEPDLRGVLKKGGFLTRDSRVVERKKYGRAKARKSFQFSKR